MSVPKSTMKPQRFNGLDHLRALAIILVLIFHYEYFFDHPDWWPPIVGFGWTGVDLFFVLSGFLISSQLFRQITQNKKISYRRFFIKRFFRIIPVYLAVTALYFAFPVIRERPVLPELWRFLTFTHNFGLDISVTNAFSHAWSLSVEEHFYVVLPLALIVLQGRHRLLKYSYWLIIILFVFGFMLRSYLWFNQYIPDVGEASDIPTWTKHIYYPTYNRLDGLLTGISLAAIYRFLPRFWIRLTQYGNWHLLIGLILLTIAYFFFGQLATYNTSVYGFPVIAIGYGFLVLGAVSSNSVLYRWKSRLTSFIAMLSYGIYLIHKIAIHLAQKWFESLGMDTKSGLMILVSALSCVLMSWILYQVVESPFMKLRQRVLHQFESRVLKQGVSSGKSEN